MDVHSAGLKVARDDCARAAVDDDEIEHLGPWIHLDCAGVDLAFERLIAAEQQLLTRLPSRIEGSRHLCAAERPVRESSAVFTRERDALGDALIDDVDADLG